MELWDEEQLLKSWEMEDEDLSDEDKQVLADIDTLVEYLKTLPHHETFMLNPLRLHDVKQAYAAISKAIKQTGCKAKVTYGTGDGDADYGFVEVEGKLIEIKDTPLFVFAVNLASNTESYPLTNGNTRMTLTFHDVFVPI